MLTAPARERVLSAEVWADLLTDAALDAAEREQEALRRWAGTRLCLTQAMQLYIDEQAAHAKTTTSKTAILEELQNLLARRRDEERFYANVRRDCVQLEAKLAAAYHELRRQGQPT